MSIGKDSINRAASVAVAKKKTGVNGKGTGDNTDAKTNADKADKKEVEKMVKITLNQEDLPKLDDTVDSIAMGICCARCCVNDKLVTK